jgi:hypothetical protein
MNDDGYTFDSQESQAWGYVQARAMRETPMRPRYEDWAEEVEASRELPRVTDAERAEALAVAEDAWQTEAETLRLAEQDGWQ